MAAEALDIKTLTTLIMATPKTDIEQSVGRILREKHSSPIVVDIIDKKSGEVIYRDFAKREVLDNLTPAEKEQRAKDAAVEAVATFFRK